MKMIELAFAIAAAAALVVWRATAMYKQTFRRKNL
jgi:hypothetical protein